MSLWMCIKITNGERIMKIAILILCIDFAPQMWIVSISVVAISVVGFLVSYLYFHRYVYNAL